MLYRPIIAAKARLDWCTMEFSQRVKARLKQVHDWNQIPSELVAEIEQMEDAAAKSKAHYDLAHACEVYLQDRATAMESYQAAFKLDRNNISALEGARRIYHEMAQLEMEQGLLKLQQKFAPSPAVQAEWGRALLDLRKTDEALTHIREAFERDPEDPRAAALMAQVNYDRSQWEVELDKITSEICEMCGVSDPAAAEAAGKGPELAQLYLRAARILQQEQPNSELIPPFLFKALDADPLCDDAGYLAELQLAERGHLPFVQRLQDRRAAAVPDLCKRAELLRQFASVWLVRYNQPETSAHFTKKALELVYHEDDFEVPRDHLASFRLLAANADAAGGVDSLVPLAQRGLEKLEGHEDRGLLAIQAAGLAQRMGAGQAVVDALMGIADIPEHPDYQAWKQSKGEPDQVANQGAAPATPPPEQESEAQAEAKRTEKAKSKKKAPAAAKPAKERPAAADPAADFDRSALGEEEMSDEEVAILAAAHEVAKKGDRRGIDAWRDAMSKLPGKIYPRTQLRALYERTKKWSGVADLIKDEIKYAEPEEQETLHWELVELYRDRLKQHGLVIQHLSALEELAENSGELDKRLSVLEAQQAQYTRMKRWAEVIGRVRARAELSESLEDRIELKLEAGNLYLEKFSNQTEAIKCFEELLEDDPSNAQAITRLKQLYQKRRDWEKLVELQQRELEGLDDPQVRKEGLLEIARTASTKVKNAGVCLRVWNSVIECDPENLEALRQLETLQERERAWPELARTLSTLTKVEQDPAARASDLTKLGIMYTDKLDEHDQAIGVWEELLSIDPKHRRAQDALRKLYLEAGNLEALEDFYARQENWSEFIRVLEREADQRSGDEKNQLILKIARLYTERLDRSDRAIRALEKGLAEERHESLAEALIDLYEEAGDERRLVEPLQIKLGATQDLDDRFALQQRIAELSVRTAQDHRTALDCLIDALREDHQRQSLVPQIMSLSEVLGAQSAAASAFEASWIAYGAVPESIPARMAAASLYQGPLDNAERALETYQGVLEIDSLHAGAEEALEKLYLSMGRAEDVLRIIQGKLERTSDEPKRLELLRRSGDIYREVGRAEEAIEAYREVVAAGQASPAVLTALAALYTESEGWEELASTLKQQLEVVESEEERVDLNYRYGETLQVHLGRAEESVEYYEQVLLANPDHAPARERLEACFDDPDAQFAACRVLLPNYEAGQQWPNVVRCLDIELAGTLDNEQRASLLRRIGSIQRDGLADQEAAFESFARAFRVLPSDEDARLALEEIAARSSWWQRYAEVVEEVSSEVEDTELLGRLNSQLSRVYEVELQDLAGAERSYRRQLAIDERDEASLVALEQLYQRSEQWSSLLDIYQRRLEFSEEPSERATVLLKTAKLQEEVLQDNSAAVQSYRSLLDDDPRNAQALAALRRLYSGNEAWNELAEILDRQLEDAQSESEMLDLSLQLAQVRADRLGDKSQAIALYARVLEYDVANNSAIGALERLLDDEDHQLEVARHLESIYRGAAQWDPLVKVLHVLVKHSEDRVEQRELLLQIAGIHGTLQQMPQAFEATGRAFVLTPDDPTAQQRLDGLAASMGADQKLIDLYQEACAESVDDELRVRLLKRVAELYESHLADTEKAAQAYERILEIRPDDVDAIDELISVHHRAQRFEALSAAVLRKAEMSEAADTQRDLLMYAALIHKTQLAQPQKAVELYERVLTVDASNQEALENLEGLHEENQDWAALRGVFERRLELFDDPSDQERSYARLAKIFDEKLQDSDRAIDTYQSLLLVAPENKEAMDALDRLYAQENRPHDQLQVLERAVAQQADAETAAQLRYRMGRLLQGQLEDPERAVQVYGELLDASPHHEGAIAALDEILKNGEDPRAAAQVLEPIYQANSAWDKLVSLHLNLGEHADDPTEKVERLQAAAAIQAEQLADTEGAFDSFESALSIDPEDSDCVARLEALAGATGQWQRFVGILEKQAENTLDPYAKVQTLMRVAEVERAQLGDTDAAIARYESILENEPGDQTAIAALDSIYTAQERWPELVANIQRQIDASEGEGWSELQFRRAQVYEHRLGEVEKAIDVYREILLVEFNHTPSIEALESLSEQEGVQLQVADILLPIYESGTEWAKVVKICRTRFSLLEDQDERFAVIQKVAQICEEQLSAQESALHWWLRAYMEDPRNPTALQEVERLAEATGLWSEVADAAQSILESEVCEESEVRVEVYLLLGNVLDRRLGEYAPAMGAYQEVLDIDEANPQALNALSRLYQDEGRFEELADVIGRQIKGELDGEKLLELELSLATINEQQLGRQSEAIAAYQRALEYEPSNAIALDALEKVYLAEQNWEQLYGVYERKTNVMASQEDLANCYQHMAKLCASTMDRREEAIDHWQRVLDIRGEDSTALAEIAALAQESGRWHDAVDALERFTQSEEDPQLQLAAYQDLGQIYGEHLEDSFAALGAWNAARAIEPNNPETLKILRSMHEESENWPDLAEILGQLSAFEDSVLAPESRRDIFARLGTVQAEHLFATEDAVAAWGQVLALQEGDSEALDALERLYENEARWKECAAVLRQKQIFAPDDSAKIEALLKIADLWEHKVEDQGEAVKAYEQILEIDAEHEQAARALESIYEDTQDWDNLSGLYVRMAESCEDGDQQIIYLQRAAKVDEEKLGDVESAFTILKVALQCDYTNEETAQELERIATAIGRWDELLQEYEAQIPHIEDPEERCSLLVKLARWYLDRGDERSIEYLEQAIALDESNIVVQRERAHFFRQLESYDDLASTLQSLVTLEEVTEEKIRTLIELAAVQRDNRQNLDASSKAYRAVLALEPGHEDAMKLLAQNCEAGESWDELVELLTRIGEGIEDPLERLETSHQIGEIQENKLEDHRSALCTYQEIVAVDPGDKKALLALERLYLASGQVDDYLDTLEAELDATYDPDEQIRVYEKMADALLVHANDPLRAAEALENIITKDSSRDDIFRKLERLYSDMGRWPEVVETYRTHVESTDDPQAKIELLNAMGKIFEEQIQDPERAKDTYSEILDLDPGNFEAVKKRSQLEEEVEDWRGAVDSLQMLAGITEDPAEKVELYTRSGRILLSHLQDLELAEQQLDCALSIDPNNVGALRQLAEVHRQREDWEQAAQTLQRASEASSNQDECENLAAAAGFIYLEELNDEDRALGMFSNVMQGGRGHARVGLTLATIYFERNEYEKAAPIYAMLSTKVDTLELDNFEKREVLNRAAFVARQSGDPERALEYYERAYALDSADRDVMVGMAQLLYEQQSWERAFELYQAILVQHRDLQSDDETVEIYYRLGTIMQHRGDARRALNYMEKALEVQPHHRETLESVIAFQSQAGDWDAVISAKLALCDVAESSERYELRREIGNIYAEKLGNRKKAAESYEIALENQPSDFSTLHTLLELHTTAEQWPETISVLDRLVEIEEDPLRRSSYNYTAAVLLRDQLQEMQESVNRFNAVLDDDPSRLKAFQAVDTILTRSKEWKELERNYRKMLKRIPTDSGNELRVALLDNLGEIYRSRLNQYPAAVEAYKLAKSIDPGNVKRRFILGELYQRLIAERPETYVEGAINELQELLYFEPHRYETYRQLFEIYRDSDQIDKAYCVASAIVWVGRISKRSMAEEEKFCARYRAAGIPKARQRLSEDMMRRHLFHPQQDPIFTAIMGIMAKPLAVTRAQDGGALLEQGNRIDISTNPAPVAQIAKYVRGVLNVQIPELVVRADTPGDMTLLNLSNGEAPMPTLVVMSNMAMRMSDQRCAAFVLGRHMAELYFPHYAYVTVDRSHRKLRDVFWAARHLCGMPVAGDQRAVEALAKRYRPYLSAGEIDGLRDLMRAMEAEGKTTDVKAWGGATELTCYRTGLLMCGDLDTALHMVSVEAQSPTSPFSPTDKAKELLLYSVSESYFAARQAIGIQVK